MASNRITGRFNMFKKQNTPDNRSSLLGQQQGFAAADGNNYDDDDNDNEDNHNNNNNNNYNNVGRRAWDTDHVAGGKGQLSSATSHTHNSSLNDPSIKANHIASSAGTHRLNRILTQSTEHRLALASIDTTGGGFGNDHHNNHSYNNINNHNNALTTTPRSNATTTSTSSVVTSTSTKDEKTVGGTLNDKVKDPHDETDVAAFCARVVVPPLKVDPRSIGGDRASANADEDDVVGMVATEDPTAPSGTSGMHHHHQLHHNHHHHKPMLQETLLCMRCKSMEFTGDPAVETSALLHAASFAKHKRNLGLFGTQKGRNKLRFIVVARSTNRPLTTTMTTMIGTTQHDMSNKANYKMTGGPIIHGGYKRGGGGGGGDGDGYDRLYAATAGDDNDHHDTDHAGMHFRKGGHHDDGNGGGGGGAEPDEDDDDEEDEDDEVSSFPCLMGVVFHTDGSNPDIRKLIPLDMLTTIQDAGATVIQLAFENGHTARIDFSLDDVEGTSMRKERFVWSLLQIHAMLCTSVVERNSLGRAVPSSNQGLLPPLHVRNLDRAELQYVATVNGFLRDSPTLCELLDRQRYIGVARGGRGPEDKSLLLHDGGGGEEKRAELEEMDGMAYDLMMGNFSTRVAIFYSADERADAEDVLNGTEWTFSLNSDDTAAATAAERLSMLLQKRMRDLEAETCRRLIAWEDEKHFSVTGQSSFFSDTAQRDTVDALALASLFNTLDSLDKELGGMEEWLQQRAAEIKPLTDDCRDIEEENRQLEQQWKSYDMLGAEMRRLLQGLDIDKSLEKVLKNPAGALVYDAKGRIDVESSERGVDRIHQAGKALQDALEHAQKAGGVHLRAVSERVEGLESISTTFCTALAQIIVTVMEQFKTDVVAASDNGKVSKSDTHTMIAKKIRDTQRKFQSSLLGYIKLIEILAVLNPKLLPAIRDAYSELVAEGIMMKKRMKGYFQALPGKNAAYLSIVTKDMKDYAPFEGGREQTVNASDIKFALNELLPIIAREAYFTSALFGHQGQNMDGREKKRHFESAKKSVDHSTQYFKYYIQRTCGIAQELDTNDPSNPGNMHIKGDPMLSLVSSVHLNEAMENYIDREKKGGDHSLSLAYVRATILDLRKKVDKQWVSWVEEQIEWIRSCPGVPANGKRAGVFMSFSRFPSYIDHILTCCREGRNDGYTPDLTNIKVISYYLQKMATALLESLRVCSERETTDQQYASHVMRMENTYFFTHCIKKRGPEISGLFQKQLTKASAICKESTDAYLGWMIKREFKELHTLFSNISRIRREVGDKDGMFMNRIEMYVRSPSFLTLFYLLLKFPFTFPRQHL